MDSDKIIVIYEHRSIDPESGMETCEYYPVGYMQSNPGGIFEEAYWDREAPKYESVEEAAMNESMLNPGIPIFQFNCPVPITRSGIFEWEIVDSIHIFRRIA